MEHAGGKLIGDAVTYERFPLVVGKLPYLFNKPGHGTEISGELYEVPHHGLVRVLDGLEGHPDWYTRSRVSVTVKGKRYGAWVYFLNNQHVPDDWQQYPTISSFT